MVRVAIKRAGIVARPGTYRDEVVTADMLKEAIQYQNRIPLIIGPHPIAGYSTPDQWVGTVSTSWNETKQRVDGEFWLFDEKYDSLPDEVKRKLANNEEINLSAGYQTTTDDNKVQRWRKWDHIALGVPNPSIPDVGIGVRMESELPDGFRTEETPVIMGEDKKDKPETVSLTPEQLAQVIDTAVEKALAKVVPPVVETIKEDETEKAPVEVEQARPDPVPEVVLPASAPKKSDMDGIEVTDDGIWLF